MKHGDAGRRDDSRLGGTEREGERFHHTARDSVRFKTCESFIPEIFLFFGPQVTENAESKIADKGGPLASNSWLL